MVSILPCQGRGTGPIPVWGAMKNITPKMLFLYIGTETRNMVFCDKNCDNCPIRYQCFTTKAMAFHITLDPKKKKMVSCTPHYYTADELRAERG